MIENNVRQSAFSVLCDFEKNCAWSDLAIKSEIKKRGFDKRDAALLCEIVYGVLENKLLCDYYIEFFSQRKIKKISPAVLNILRLSVYQIAFLDKIPVSAAVNQGVELAKKKLYGNRAAGGFVNAVLRKIAANADNLPEPENRGTPQYLSVKFSHPLWFAEEMCRRFGYDEAEKILSANNMSVPMTVRVNTLKTTEEDLIESLRSDGIVAERHGKLADCIIMSHSGDIASLEQFKRGLFYVQDAASQTAVMALAPKSGQKVIDMCAAPGGKSLLAAQLMKNEGEIIAFDAYAHKIKLIRQNSDRMGIRIIHEQLYDSTVFRPELEKSADSIICDVPCSGSGVIRKKPEIRYKKREDIENLKEIQQKILKNAANYLKIGGKMIYSTCSVLESENEDVVKRFLIQNSGYELCPFEIRGIAQAETGMITFLPHKNNTDGFFIAKLKRTN